MEYCSNKKKMEIYINNYFVFIEIKIEKTNFAFFDLILHSPFLQQ